ncbi:MAG: HD domain-containing protein [Elusimicrobiales bacterium]
MFSKIFGSNSYIVGGCIRDCLLSKGDIKDIDIVCIACCDDFKDIIKRASKRFTLFALDKERDIWRVTLGKGLTIDISRADDLFSDIIRRDFTINSLAIKIGDVDIRIKKETFLFRFSDKKILDLTKKGFKDISDGVVRHITEKVFDEDPLRILRAFRLASQFNLRICPSTKKLICKKKKLIHIVAAERIRDEIVKMASTDRFFTASKLMLDTEVLFELFTDLKKQVGCANVYYGKDGVIKHTLSVIERLDMYFEKPQRYTDIPPSLIQRLEEERYLIKIAGLFHDIAKPHTARVIDGRLRFFGHEQKGVEITKEYLERFRFSNKEIDYILSIIKHHLRIGSIASNDPLTKKALLRVFYDVKQYTLGLLVLSWADYASHIKKSKLLSIVDKIKKTPQPLVKKLSKTGLRKTIRFMQVVNLMIKNYNNFSFALDIKPLLDGNDIMKLLSIPPSPLVGKIKKRLINLQLEGKITTKEKAAEYVRNFFKSLSL